MNLKYLTVILMLLNATIIEAQTKPKTQTNTPSKPSKEVTLNYINEKLRTYGVEYHKSIKEWGTYDFSDINGGTQDFVNTENYWASNYQIFEANNRLYLRATFSKRILNKIEVCCPTKMQVEKDESYSWTCTAPIDQLSSIEVRRARSFQAPGYPMNVKGSKYDKWTSYDSDDLSFSFSSKCALSIFDDNSKEYVNWFIIAVREGEENLLEKLKKAFLNLQSYYPKPAGDPFDN